MRSNSVAEMIRSVFCRPGQAQAAQALENEVEDVGAGDAHRQHPQGGGGLVGHHAVVDVHHEQWRGQGDEVDHKAGGDGVDVQPFAAQQGVAEPRASTWDEVAVVDVVLVLRLGEEHPAAVVADQRLAADQHLAAVAFAEQQACGVGVFPAQQHGGAAFLEQQHGRHGDAGDLLELALQHAPLQAGAGGGTGQQLGGEALGGQGQPGGQHHPAGGFLVQHAQGQQTVQQRIVVLTTRIMTEQDSTDFDSTWHSLPLRKLRATCHQPSPDVL